MAKPFPCDASCSGLVSNMSNCYPSRQVITMLSVTTRKLTLDGPITLVQTGQPAFIMRHPIFVNTTLAAGADPWGLGPVNETFGRSYGEGSSAPSTEERRCARNRTNRRLQVAAFRERLG